MVDIYSPIDVHSTQTDHSRKSSPPFIEHATSDSATIPSTTNRKQLEKRMRALQAIVEHTQEVLDGKLDSPPDIPKEDLHLLDLNKLWAVLFPDASFPIGSELEAVIEHHWFKYVMMRGNIPSYMPHSEIEPAPKNVPPSEELLDGNLNPRYVEWAFERIINDEDTGYEGKPRRKPFRIRQVWEACRPFFYRNEGAPLSVLAEPFIDHNRPYTNPFGRAQTVISKINEAFRKHEIDLEIQRDVVYRLHRRSKP
jgi:hypothetical protein